MKTVVIILGLALTLTGCKYLDAYFSGIDEAIESHDRLSKSVELGASKVDVLALLEPTQASLKSVSYRKQPDHYLVDGRKFDIYYYRSGWNSDGITTDDEFTPYTFVDDVLVSIGWQAIGGPQTQGQAAPVTHKTTINQNSVHCTPNYATGGCL